MGAAAGFKLLEFDAFERAGEVPPEFARADRRRFNVMLLPLANEVANRQRGGMGSVSKAINAFGEQFALKTLLPLSETAGGSVARARTYAVRLAAFQEEYRVHARVSGMEGFPDCSGRRASAAAR